MTKLRIRLIKKKKNLAQDIQLVSGKTRIQTQVWMMSKPMHLTTMLHSRWWAMFFDNVFANTELECDQVTLT